MPLPATWRYTGRWIKKTAWRGAVLVAVALLVWPGAVRAEPATATAALQEFSPPAKGSALVINIPSFTLTYFRDGKEVKRYPVAVGKPTAPTPVGSFRIISKVVNPTWYPPFGGRPVPPGPGNPLGRRWLGFLPSGYGVHGNNNPSSIGKAVSLGCVRMRNEDVEELFPLIPVGTPLMITYETLGLETDPMTGQTCLVFYPDVYRRGTPTVEAVLARLKKSGLDGHYAPAEIKKALVASRRGASFVSLGTCVRVAGQEETVETTVVSGETLLAVRPVLAAFKLPVGWDARRKAVVIGTAVLPVHLVEQRSFARLGDLQRVLGIKSAWNDEDKVLELFQWAVKVNGEDLGCGAWYEGDQVWLPAGAIAQALGTKVSWDPERQVALGAEKEWPGRLRGQELYVSPAVLAELLSAKVTVLAGERLVEVVERAAVVPVTGAPEAPAKEEQPTLPPPAAPPAAPAADEVQEAAPVRALEENTPAGDPAVSPPAKPPR
ncbi:L,D-transpeptidase family protein [Gelria sp. Kuro-4]|uniref:L,D-transpeptidase family protein n=1 Tax=Gelria sp. Kuro-4 TaxID=2796927 RepID=UPI001BF04BC7|nr:L,D-transpeptidase family protein [Gelria sp. Kuro-4]BCV25357.1 hypothetical protein kuro4_21300 [Gelria sp. Kuro-4]